MKSNPAFDRVMRAFAGDKAVTTGPMMASMGLKVNGKIFAMLRDGRLVAKLPKARVDELVDAGRGSRFDPRGDGRVMKEWIVLKGATPPWIALAREAYQFVKSVR
jgi:TfoX/Sxy family transcriptional regulator of competence genes